MLGNDSTTDSQERRSAVAWRFCAFVEDGDNGKELVQLIRDVKGGAVT